MKRFWQVVANLALYGLLLYLAVETTFIEPDPWFAFVVWFLLLVAVVITVTPGLRVSRVSPGEYPHED
jgi:hypothetical protein